MRSLKALIIAIAILTPAASSAADGAAVKAWETTVTIPTYLAGDPEPNPMFYFGRVSQGAQAPVYPYPFYDTLTGRKTDKNYTIVYLENEYLRIGVLPEVGGRIFEGVDKTNGYNFIYRQHVIKPALIGLLGAWISGGLEWNIPHHHRATTFIPVQYRIEDRADGGKTVWVGELELRDRMRWVVGYTLRPGKSYLEAAVRIVNRTPEFNTMLCFANLAVHANDTYQVIFPPGTRFGVHHAKREFTDWPIARGTYGGADFTGGVDISYYRNHQTANSVFAWNYDADFFAGYDHGKEAGTLSIADHHVVPGKKFWTWGNGPFGRRWDAILTDDDGPYLELMVGAYSDNQPDYSWLQPYETRTFTMYWYPFRGIGGVKSANLDAALNVEVVKRSARIGFYTTSAHQAVRAVLRTRDRVLLDETVAVGPAAPFVKELTVPGGIDERDLTASLWEGEKELVSYTPPRPETGPPPPVVTPPPSPADVKTTEELYLIGLRAQQFHDPNINPLLYWQEALRRDPGDTRVNTSLGITAYRKARYAEAESYFRKAIERLTDRYTSPKDGEALYDLGSTLQAEGKIDEAVTWLNKATWSEAWKASAYYALAQIATGRGDMEAALEYVNRSLAAGALNLRAQNLKAAVLRHLARGQDALQVLTTGAYAVDPLDVRSMAETWLLTRDKEAAARMTATMAAHPATAEETAAEYLDEGLWQDGSDVLRQLTASAAGGRNARPTVFYYLAYFAEKLGQQQEAKGHYREAMHRPVDYVFPFQPEAIPVLRAAIRANPQDARAPYYLGNLLYDWQPEEATRLWEVSVTLDPGFAIVHRNLATAYMHQASGADLPKAVAELERAVAQPRKYALHFTELDQLYEESGKALEPRLQLLAQNASVIALRDDAVNRQVALQVALGQLDPAIATMSHRSFAVAEGANLNVTEHWIDAHLLRAQRAIAQRQYPQAKADLDAAAKIPENLPIDRNSIVVRSSELAWWTGVIEEGTGNHAGALEAWTRGASIAGSVSAGRRGGPRPAAVVQDYYRALALTKLGLTEKANDLFRSVLDRGQRELSQGPSSDRLRVANAHYLIGLGRLGLQQTAEAKAELMRAVEISPDLVGARAVLMSIP